MISSPPSKEESRSGGTSAFFRCYSLDKGNKVHWYRLDLGNDVGEDDDLPNPAPLKPFSKVQQKPGFETRTIVGFRSFLYSFDGSYVCRYDTSNPDRDIDKPWETVCDMKQFRVCPNVVALNGKIYVMGGFYVELSKDVNANEKTLKNWAEIYNPDSNKWSTLTVYDVVQGKEESLYLILNPKRDPEFDFTAEALDSSHILFVNDSDRSYLYNAHDNYVKLIEKNSGRALYFPDAFVKGNMQYMIDWDTGLLSGLRMDKSVWYESKQTFCGGLEGSYYEGANNHLLLRVDSLPDCAKRFHVIWFVKGGATNGYDKMYYRVIEFPEEVNSNQVGKQLCNVSIKSTKCYSIPFGLLFRDGLVLAQENELKELAESTCKESENQTSTDEETEALKLEGSQSPNVCADASLGGTKEGSSAYASLCGTSSGMLGLPQYLFTEENAVAGKIQGTTRKCKTCGKAVYLKEELTADDKVYHTACFRCPHCKVTLKDLRASNIFGGTKEKCVACNKTVYPLEKVEIDGTAYHRSCFKCSYGGCVLSLSNYISHEHKLFCKNHHTQLYKTKGNFSLLGPR